MANDRRWSRRYRFVRGIARTLLRAEYRSIEVSGADRVPAAGPVVLVANHENSLVDSMAILVASPRMASPLAKAPLFKVRLVKPFLEALGGLPVYRTQDAAENEGRGARANLDMFAACRERLGAGGSIVVFPEGVSQPRPKLMPLRTGAARIALDVLAPVSIVPVGLVYETPGERRGRILVRFGDPFVVDGSTVGSARRGAISSTTRRIETSLRGLLAEAESQGDLAAMRVLAVIGAQEEGLPPPATMEEAHARTQALARGYAALRVTDPAEVEGVRADTDAFTRTLSIAGIPLELLDVPFPVGRVVAFAARTLSAAIFGAPLDFLASVVTWPARAIGEVLVARSSGVSEDLVALNRIVGQATIHAIFTLTLAAVLGVVLSPWAAVAVLLGLPSLFFLHVAWRDWRHDAKARIRTFSLLAGGRLRRDLRRQRRDLHERVQRARTRIASTPADGALSSPAVG